MKRIAELANGWKGGGYVMATALAESPDEPIPWAVGFFFGNTEFSLELRTVIAGGGRGLMINGFWTDGSEPGGWVCTSSKDKYLSHIGSSGCK